MTTAPPPRKCPRCFHDVARDALVCEQCHALIHSEQLERIAAHAKILEGEQKWHSAREQWLQTLPLLPQDSTQAAWISNHVRDLEHAALDSHAPEPENKWVSKLAPLGPIAIVLAKSKSLLALFKMNFLFSLVAFLWVYWVLYGAVFGIGFAVLVLVHEMGHFVDIKRRGLPVDMPVFLPGLGAYVRWQALGVTAETRAAVSLAGPLAGWIAAAACGLLWWLTGNGLWAALARTSAWLNVLNLIPVWALDGGQAAGVLGKAERVVMLTASLALLLIFKERIFLLLVIGATYRLFTKDVPARPSPAIAAYFVVLMTLLGAVMVLVPGQGAGVP